MVERSIRAKQRTRLISYLVIAAAAMKKAKTVSAKGPKTKIEKSGMDGMEKTWKYNRH